MIQVRCEYVFFRDIEESPLNAQEMSMEDFNRLVKNIKEDGCLTSTPLLMDQEGKSKKMCISGHHRIKAGIKAGLLGADCMIIPQVPESTRIRLQLAHNDIHGNPNEEIIAELQKQLNEVDLRLVDFKDIETRLQEAKNTDYSVPDFSYLQVCLLTESRQALQDMIEFFDKSDSEKWLIEHPDYEKLKDLLTLAFRKGFKTPGRAFRKFLDIVEEYQTLIIK